MNYDLGNLKDQTVKMLYQGDPSDYFDLWQTSPGNKKESLGDILRERFNYNLEKNEDNNFIYASTPRDDGLPTLTAIADAYRHAATSAIMSKDRGKFTTQMLGLGLEGMDVISRSVGVLKDGKTPFFEKFDKMGNIFGDSSMDAYNNKLGLKYSGSKSDVLSALNIAFEKQLNRMKNPSYKFQENIDFKFDKR